VTRGERGRLLVADRDAALRRLISKRFEREGYDVVEVADPGAVVDKVVAVGPDLVMIEVGHDDDMDQLLGLREATDVAVIALLWPDSRHDEATVLDLGADDCVLRPVSFRSLVARTNAVLRRARPLSARRIRYGSLELDLSARTVTVRGVPVELAAREFDLLAFMAAHPGEAFTREELLARVWQSSADWQQRETVTEHIHRLRNRIEHDPAQPRWLVTVRGVGYRFASAAPEEGLSSITRITPSAAQPTASGVDTTRQSMA
jgi:two-component system phosphate regulon response regulator PhoB